MVLWWSRMGERETGPACSVGRSFHYYFIPFSYTARPGKGAKAYGTSQLVTIPQRGGWAHGRWFKLGRTHLHMFVEGWALAVGLSAR
jgi:hypothetical protein